MKIPVMFPAPITVPMFHNFFRMENGYEAMVEDFRSRRPFVEFENTVGTYIRRNSMVNTGFNRLKVLGGPL